MELDLRTLFFTLTAVEAVLAAMLLLIWKTQRSLTGISPFTVGTLLAVIGGLLTGFRGTVPVALSILGSNLCFTASILLALRGLRAALGRPARPVFEAVMVVLMALGLGYFTLVDFDTAARIMIADGLFATISFVGAFEMSRERRTDLKVACSFMAVVFILYATTQMVTVTVTFFVGAGPVYLQTRTAVTAMTMLATIGAVVAWTVGFLWIAYDLSQTRLRKVEKLDAVGRLAGGVAHELNNILMPIGGLSETVLEEMPADDPRRRRLELVVTASRRAADLVGSILTFGRRQDTVTPERIDIAATLRDVLDRLRPGFPPDLSVEAVLDEGTGEILADAGHVRMVLENLTANALEAMEDGAGRLQIALSAVELRPRALSGVTDLAPGHYAKLTVADNGRGMNPATLDHAIDPFFTTKEVGHGVGLGLSVVNGIVAMAGGALNISSIPGLGTTVDVYLPLAGKQESD